MVYINFNLKKADETPPKEIVVSLVMVNEKQSFDKPKANESKRKKNSEKQKDIAKKQVKKKTQKKKATRKPKKKSKEKIKKKKEKLKLKKPSGKSTSKNKVPKFKKNEKKKLLEDNQKKSEIDKKDQKKSLANKKDLKELKNTEKKNDEATSLSSLDNINLSAREKFNIQSQLKICYKKAIRDSKYKNFDQKVKLSIVAKFDKKGFITSNLEEVLSGEEYNNSQRKNYEPIADVITKALNFCSPMRNLPLDKYDIWKEVLLEFGGE